MSESSTNTNTHNINSDSTTIPCEFCESLINIEQYNNHINQCLNSNLISTPTSSFIFNIPNNLISHQPFPSRNLLQRTTQNNFAQ